MELRTEMIGAAPVPAQNIDLQQRSSAVKPDPASRPVPVGSCGPVQNNPVNKAQQGGRTEEMMVNFQIGEQYFASGEYGKALQSYKAAEKYARADLNNVNSCIVLSNIYERRGNQKLSIELAKRALDIENENNMLLRMESFPQRSESREALYLLGAAYLKGGLPAKALEVLSGYSAKGDSARISKETINLSILHAQAVYASGSDDPAKYQEALEEIKAVEAAISKLFGENDISAEKAEVDFEMLGAYSTFGMYDEAIRTGEKLSERFPNYPGMTQILASCYLSKLDYDKAISLLAGQDGINSADFSKMDAQSVLLLYSACMSKIGTGKAQQNEMETIIPKLMERASALLAEGGTHFPENTEMMGLRQVSYSSSSLYGKSAEISDTLAGNMPSGGEMFNNYTRQALNDRIIDSIISNTGFLIDGVKVEIEKLESFDPQNKDVGVAGPGQEMRLLSSNKYGNPYFLRDPNMGRLKADLSAKRPDYMTISVKEAVLLAADLTMGKLHYTDESYSADLPHVPLEDKIDGGKGVCRHYAPIFKAYFEAIKSENPNLAGTYCINLMNNSHTWDMVVDVRPGGMIALNIDPTFDDSDSILGNNLDGSDQAHFDPLADDLEVLQRNIDNNPGKEWIPEAILKQASMKLNNSDFDAALKEAKGFLEKYPDNANAPLACYLGIQAAFYSAITNNEGSIDDMLGLEAALLSMDASDLKKNTIDMIASFYSKLSGELLLKDPKVAEFLSKRAFDLIGAPKQ